MIVINDALLDAVSAKAAASPRRRMNHNFHRELDDPLQRMLNCLQTDTYIQPHKHENPDKCEAFILLKGKALVLEFDEEGKVTSHAVLQAGSGLYGAEIAPRVYHGIIPLEDGSVVYEVKNGPYSPLNDKNFAKWAPKEGTKECAAYIERLCRQYACNH
ncbi:MAG: WbuC family cupin fold metalloprotein [Bacteroidales bacterium]|jgi:cupin fold WbuC family metalloprotein|nr:WbuC family cupin fold metalloprotein [Bacteroidales bacterium]